MIKTRGTFVELIEVVHVEGQLYTLNWYLDREKVLIVDSLTGMVYTVITAALTMICAVELLDIIGGFNGLVVISRILITGAIIQTRASPIV